MKYRCMKCETIHNHRSTASSCCDSSIETVFMHGKHGTSKTVLIPIESDYKTEKEKDNAISLPKV